MIIMNSCSLILITYTLEQSKIYCANHFKLYKLRYQQKPRQEPAVAIGETYWINKCIFNTYPYNCKKQTRKQITELHIPAQSYKAVIHHFKEHTKRFTKRDRMCYRQLFFRDPKQQIPNLYATLKIENNGVIQEIYKIANLNVPRSRGQPCWEHINRGPRRGIYLACL